MKSLDQILDEVDRFTPIDDAASVAGRLLGLAECILERWIEARGDAPTAGTREGFRLLALHRQGAQDAPRVTHGESLGRRYILVKPNIDSR